MALPAQADFLANLAADKCPICYEPFVVPIKTECGHSFCMKCAKEWFTTARTCPSCRTPLYKKPEDWEDSDSDEGEDIESSEEIVDEEIQVAPRTLTVIPDTDGPLIYDDWIHVELLDAEENLEVNLDDDLFRETLVSLCFTEEDHKHFWEARPDWDDPILITRLHLRSQTIAAIVRLTPDFESAIEARLNFREACCWSGWAEAGRYVLAKLSELWDEWPEQTARALYGDLSSGWLQHLEVVGLPLPKYDERCETWGTFEQNVDQLFTQVVIFAQETARRYSNARNRSSLPTVDCRGHDREEEFEHQEEEGGLVRCRGVL
ncbi:uncharacterized protein CLAFUR5_12173 [Fulvia fulva]|uniref:RING-type domain-containing protein n=1 Tax=Passalora fulva TaxID=5499 RepID=A0A9Q8PI10_PASFU|nr:uncharacterized protein CLAFUR5_12173 [Fulvia fulva]UJO22775.1 hypothetical protein CLAFUR5_12173 [Fulvia fulva]